MPKKTPTRSKLTRKQQRDLDVEIGFIEGVLRRDPKDETALQILGDDYTRRGRIADGLKIDEQITQLHPDDALAHYNLACSFSLNGRIDEALKALLRSIRLGYRDFSWMQRDKDLKKLRADPAYAVVIAVIEQETAEKKP